MAAILAPGLVGHSLEGWTIGDLIFTREKDPDLFALLDKACQRIQNAPADFHLGIECIEFFGWVHTVLGMRKKNGSKYSDRFYLKQLLYECDKFEKKVRPGILQRNQAYHAAQDRKEAGV